MPTLLYPSPLKLFINVKEAPYGAKGDGTTDDTTAISNAITALGSNGGVLYFPPGVYISGPQTIDSKQWWLGAGYEASILKLKASSNADFIKTANFATLTGGNTTGGSYNFGIEKLTIDGNKSSNTSGGSRGIVIYGYGYTLRDVRVRNCYKNCFYSEWSTSSNSPGADAMEAIITDCKFHDCQQDGFLFYGPHDSHIKSSVIYNSGLAGAGNGYSNLHIGSPGSAGVNVDMVHVWSGGVDYGIQIDNSSTLLNNCVAEGAAIAQLYVNANDCQIHSCWIFDGGASSSKGILYGNSGNTVFGSLIRNTRIDGCPSGFVDFTYLGAQNSDIQLFCYAATTDSGIVGTAPTNANVQILTSLGTSGPTNNALYQMYGKTALYPATASQTALQIKSRGSQSADVFQFLDSGGSKETAFGSNGNLAIGPVNPNTTIPLLIQGRNVTDRNIVLVAQTSQTASVFVIQDASFANLTQFGLNGNLGLNATPSTTTLIFAKNRAVGDVGLVIQAITSQTGDFVEVKDSSSNVLTSVAVTGNVGIGDTPSATMELYIKTRSDSDNGIVIKRHSSTQSANLLEAQDESGNRLTRIGPHGNFGIGLGENSTIIFNVQARADGDRGMVFIQHSATQTGNLMEMQDSSFVVLGGFDNWGRLKGGNGYAPTSSALTNNGGSAPAPVIGTNAGDLRGQLTFGSGTSPSAGAQISVTYSKACGTAPIVAVFGLNAATIDAIPYATTTSTTGFQVSFRNAPSASQANTVYSVGWIAIG